MLQTPVIVNNNPVAHKKKFMILFVEVSAIQND